MAGSISYDTVETLNIDLGSGNDTFTIASTHTGSTELSTNAGNDTINVWATSGLTTVYAGQGDDKITLGRPVPATGGGVLSDINGKLIVYGGPGTDELNIDDSGNTQPATLTLEENGFTGFGMGSGGLEYWEIETLNISLGSGGNTINVLGIAVPVHLNTGSGDDTVKVGGPTPRPSGDMTLNRVVALLTLDGQTGNDTLYADDSGDNTDNSGVLSASAITGLLGTNLGMTGAIGYSHFEGVDLALGNGNDTLTITGTTQQAGFRTQTVVSTGAGDDTVTVALNATIDGPLSVNLQAGNDTLDASTSSLGIVVFGGIGNDQITGGSGDDVIFGDRGTVDLFNAAAALVTRLGIDPSERSTDATNALYVPPKLTDGGFNQKRVSATRDTTVGGIDKVLAGAGNDLIFGGAGRDWLEGQDGNDTLLGDNGLHISLTGNTGNTDAVTLTDSTSANGMSMTTS